MFGLFKKSARLDGLFRPRPPEAHAPVEQPPRVEPFDQQTVEFSTGEGSGLCQMVRHVGRVAFWTIGLDVSTRTSSSNHWEIYEVNESWTGSFCGGNTDLEFTFTRISPIKNVIEHWASHMNLRCQVFGAVFVVVFVAVGDVVVVLLVLLAKHIQNLGDLTKGKFQRHLINTFQ